MKAEGGRPATADEQKALARWSGWGSLPAVFDEHAASYAKFEAVRSRLLPLLSAEELEAAKVSTINAHYTDGGIVAPMWDALKGLGFAAGRVLEPGCGSGNFIGFAPEGTEMVGVELDPTTAGVAGALYPDAQVRAESFAETRIPEQSVDAVVGNVPFGDVVLRDQRHNAGGHSIHNHFILKGLHLLRPGGVAALVTSRYTMDSQNPAARREMAQLADFLGAVRLPSGAHREAAGTDVVTDILLFRRREPGAEIAGEAFETTSAFGDASSGLRCNDYFKSNPEQVLGSLTVGQGQRGRPELLVKGDRSVGPALGAALSAVVEAAKEQGLVHAPVAAEVSSGAIARVDERRPDGFLSAHPDGTFTELSMGLEVPFKVPSTQAGELRALLGLRDVAMDLLQAEAASADDTPRVGELRATLNRRYDAYFATHGAINRFTTRPAKKRKDAPVDEEEEQAVVRVFPRQGAFEQDPFSAIVYGLEVFDESTMTATKAAIFSQRVVSRRPQRLGADSPAEALAICLDDHGEVRLSEIARLLGATEQEARARLGNLVFMDPAEDRLVPAAEYLSGNVREKHELALQLASSNSSYEANAKALAAVLPRDLGPAEIDARMGAAWIPAEDIQRFLCDILESEYASVEHGGGSRWKVSNASFGVLARSRWGTESMPAGDIAEHVLTQRPIRVSLPKWVDGERVLVFDLNETLAANEKATEMQARFGEWVWENPERAARLARSYNDKFNAIVLRNYDGANLSLPGLALTFRPHPHQLAGVARVLSEPTAGLYHEVGAGKTATMVIAAMELRRIGLVQKPLVVIPNHMIEQFRREWLQLYPQSHLLAVTKEDLGQEERRIFVARCATGNWDGVVMTQSAFSRIPVSLKTEKEYVEREVAALAEALAAAKRNGNQRTLKEIQKAKLNLEQKLKARLDTAKDPAVNFEMLGVDYLFIDEAHCYKNLRTPSHIESVAIEGSKRATDLDMKIGYLREKRSRVATFATATPIANSMAEAYVFQKFLRPDILAKSGITDFDTWASTFGQMQTAVEVAPDGSGLRMQTRFSKFRNVPEMLGQWRVSADIKTAEDLKLPVPLLRQRADGLRAPEIVLVPPSAELVEFVSQLAMRAEAVRNREVDPTEDNMLKISSEGRAAALDLRLVGIDTQDTQKITYAARKIAEIYHANKNRQFPAEGGGMHPTPGALQLVFSDLGTPKVGKWNVYDALKAELVALGLPKSAVRFVHDAETDQEKGDLFAACRDGRVAVLLGSTSRMGVGTNVQFRAVGLHHLDCPWRPADIIQREGRLVRQGNFSAEVDIYRYVTERSFDAYVWQAVSRKAQFIAQVMRGKLDVREIEDIGDAALSYQEVKALATGNPLLLDEAEALASVQRLERLQRSHQRNIEALRYTVSSGPTRLAYVEKSISAVEDAIAKRPDMSRETFKAVIDGETFEKPIDANGAIRRAFRRVANAYTYGDYPVTTIGTVRGFEITAQRAEHRPAVNFGIVGVPGDEDQIGSEGIETGNFVSRVENKLKDLETTRDGLRARRRIMEIEFVRAQEESSRPFRQTAELEASRQRLREVRDQLQKASARQPVEVSTATATEPVPLSAFGALKLPDDRLTVFGTAWLNTVAGELEGREQPPCVVVSEPWPGVVRSIVVTDSALDGIAYRQKHEPDDALYVSVGSIKPEALPEALNKVLTDAIGRTTDNAVSVRAAFGQSHAGLKQTDALRRAFQAAVDWGATVERHPPSRGRWADEVWPNIRALARGLGRAPGGPGLGG